MNIALYNLTTTTIYGGVESFVWDLARELARRHHAVTIIGGNGPRREDAPGVRVLTFPFVSRRLFQRAPLLRRAYAEAKLLERLSLAVAALPALARGGYDIIHLQKPYDIGPALLARRLGGARVILGCHGEDFYRGDRALARRVDGAVSCSRFNAQTVAARYGFVPQVVFNGIDIDMFRPQERESGLRQTLLGVTEAYRTAAQATNHTSFAAGAKADTRCQTLLLWVGRMQPWKGLDTAIRALAHIPGAVLAIAGDGEERARLAALTVELGLAERVRFLGPLPRVELPRYYAAADLLLATSFASETFGIGPVEAQACGLPVVASRFGGFPEVVDEGRTGLLVPPRDPLALAEACNALLADPERLRAMSAAAPDWAAQFGWGPVADRVEAAYREALTNERGGGAAGRGPPATLNILLVTTYGFDPAFPSRPEQLQARALLRRGHAVTAHEYLDPRYPGQSRRHEWLPGGIAVHRSATLGFFAPEALLRLLLTQRPDVIHLHHMRSLLGFQTVRAARRLGIPTLLTVHGLLHDGDLVADRERPLEAPLRFDNLLLTSRQLAARLVRGAHPRRAFRNYLIHAPLRWVDRLIALSQHEAGLLAQLGVDPARIVVLPNAVELSLFRERSGEAEPLQEKNTILFIGQLVPRKGYDLLARAMPLVLRVFPQARFVFVGRHQQGEDDLRRMASEGGALDRLELRGWVDEAEKIRLLRQAAVVAAPSRYEGFGIPLIEALAAGAAVVTTDIPAGNEVVAHERTGLLTAYGDAEALGAAIIRLLGDRELAQRLGAAGRAEVLARYDADALALDLERLYTRTIAGGRP